MQQKAGSIYKIFFYSLFFSGSALASPWYTGPLLAPAGHTIPKGHINIEPYIFFTDNNGTYNRHWQLSHAAANRSTILTPSITYGIGDKTDVQFNIPYAFNQNQGANAQGFSDIGVIFGYQLLEQQHYVPNLRVTLQEIFPTGKYQHLQPANQDTDAGGLGSYQTAINFNFQHLLPINEINYLRTRLSLAYVYAQPVSIAGLSSYGGSINTAGKVNPGNMVSADLAWELSVTQQWVAVMEGYFAHRQATSFKGFSGTTNGLPATIGHDAVDSLSLAPAIEYNFNQNIGIIGGEWFTVTGRNTTKFHSAVLALNIFW